MINFYAAVLKDEKRKSFVEKKQAFRAKVNAHAGVNKTVSRILKGTVSATIPKVLGPDGRVMPPAAAVDAVQDAWMKYYAKPSVDPEAAIFEALEYQPWQCGLSPITPQDILGILREQGQGTAPVPDSWRADELAQLPMTALQQLSLIYGIMEDRGQAPSTVVAG